MGMDAEVLVIGSYRALREIGALDYPEVYYRGASEDAVVVGSISRADTSDQSRRLAALCGVEPWALETHVIVGRVVGIRTPSPPQPFRPEWDRPNGTDERSIGTDAPETIWEQIVKALKAGCTVIYRPNG